ncbi:MAG: hypothetical protein J7J44_06795 [Deltaproteobacteria bacterium]|nr:hypothetical protein [Deltaproteobacteria bacterium]
MKKKRELTFLDSPENRAKIMRYFYITLLILLILDFFVPKHGHFSWELAPEFFAVYGFLALVTLTFIAKALRFFVRRKEDYYEMKRKEGHHD